MTSDFECKKTALNLEQVYIQLLFSPNQKGARSRR